MAERNWSRIPTRKNASQLFTDREEPVAAFWEKLHAVDDDSVNSSSRVITFYGEGGIGKTWLLQNRLINEVNNGKDKLHKKFVPVYCSLETTTNLVEFLCSARAQIACARPGFPFPSFDAAIKLYEEKENTKINFMKENRLNNSLKKLEDICDVASMASVIPGIAEFYGAVKIARKSTDLFKAAAAFTRLPEVKEMVEDALTCETAEDIIDNICSYFAFDLNYFERNFSVVFMIDTLEILEHKEKQFTVKNLITHFLPYNTRNLLWVFAGRDKIYDDDSEIVKELDIDEHLIGDLSREDSYLYLREKQNVRDEEIVEKIYEVSGGTPILLDLCVRTYRTQGEPGAEAFSVDDRKQIVERYVKYLGDRERDVIRAMSSIQHWTDDDFREVFMSIMGLNEFTSYLSAYRSLTESTMIEKINDERFFLHKSVRMFVYDDPSYPAETREKTRAAMISLYRKRLEADDADVMYYKDRVVELLENLSRKGEELSNDEVADMSYILEELSLKVRNYGFAATAGIAEVLDAYTEKAVRNPVFRAVFVQYAARFYFFIGEHEKAMEMDEAVLDSLEKEEWDTSDFVVVVMTNLLNFYNELGRTEDAFKLAERGSRLVEEHEAFKTQSALMNAIAVAYQDSGDLDAATSILEELLSALQKTDKKYEQTYTMINLGVAYSGNEQYEKGRDKFEEALEMMHELSLDMHPDTFTLKYNLALCYDCLGNAEKAIEIREELLKYCEYVYGEDSEFEILLLQQNIESYHELGIKDGRVKLETERLIRLYNATGREDKAQELIKMNN